MNWIRCSGVLNVAAYVARAVRSFGIFIQFLYNFYLVLIMGVTFHKAYRHFVSAYLHFKFVSV